MKRFFEEYGGVIVTVAVVLVLLVALGVYNTSTNKGSGVAKKVSEGTSDVTYNYKKKYFDTSDNRKGFIDPAQYVSKSESQVGKYADVDGDGTVDGIIFADLLFGGSGEYGTNGDGKYTITKISSCKDYYVSQNSYTNKLGGTTEVLTPIGDGNSRFYVMALTDVDENYHNWYHAAYYNNGINDYSSIIGNGFGKGKSNTTTMIDKWKNKIYGDQNTDTIYDRTDIWNEVQSQAANGWFVPSKQEWSVFAKHLEITTSNYSSKGLCPSYSTSSLLDTDFAYEIHLISGKMFNIGINGGGIFDWQQLIK